MKANVVQPSNRGGLAGLARRFAALARRGPSVKVGFPRGSGVHINSNMLVAQLAAIHEFGTDDGVIPERSFLRSAMVRFAGEHGKIIKRLAKDISTGDRNQSVALGLLGATAAANVQRQIVDVKTPPNTAETIRRKGSSNPLIDEGQLRQSVTWEVNS